MTHDGPDGHSDAAADPYALPDLNPAATALLARIWAHQDVLRDMGAVLSGSWSNGDHIQVNFSSDDEDVARRALRSVLGLDAESIHIGINSVSEDWAGRP